jgi:hypothetical protein
VAYKNKRTAVYLPSELMEKVKLLAQKEDRSIAKMTELLVRKALK